MSGKHFLLVSLCIVLVLASASFVHAADFRAGGTYTVSGEEDLVDDLYVAGKVVTVEQDIEGDLVAAGRSVVVNGRVEDDLWIAGAAVSIFGSVGDGVRAAGAQVVIRGDVDGDVLVGAGSVHILEQSKIEGDLFIGGGQAIIDGEVLGDVRFVGSDLVINGVVEGTVTAEIGGTLTLGSDAKIDGDLVYSSVDPGAIPEGVVAGEVVFNESGQQEQQAGDLAGAFFAVLLGAFVLIKTIALVVSGVLVVVLFKKFSVDLVEETSTRFGGVLIRGLIVFVALPIISLIILTSVVGGLIGAIGLLLFGILMFLAVIFSGVLAGSVLAKVFVKRYAVDWKWTIAGVVALSLIQLIPIVGYLITAVFFLAALGYLWNTLYQRFWIGR